MRQVVIVDGVALVLHEHFPVTYHQSGTRAMCDMCGLPIDLSDPDHGHGLGECVPWSMEAEVRAGIVAARG